MTSDLRRITFAALALAVSASTLTGCLLVPLIEPDAQGRGISGVERSVSRGTIRTSPKKVPATAENRSQRRFDELLSNLRNGNTVTRTHAAFWLGELGPSGRAAVPGLSYAVRHDESRWVRRASAKALGKIRTADTVQPLKDATKDRDKWVAHSAQNALNAHPFHGRSQ